LSADRFGIERKEQKQLASKLKGQSLQTVSFRKLIPAPMETAYLNPASISLARLTLPCLIFTNNQLSNHIISVLPEGQEESKPMHYHDHYDKYIQPHHSHQRTHSQCKQHHLYRIDPKLGPTPTGSTSTPVQPSALGRSHASSLYTIQYSAIVYENRSRNQPLPPKPIQINQPPKILLKNTHTHTYTRGLSIIMPKATAPRIKITVCTQSHNAQ
jgi:hypothetical protein